MGRIFINEKGNHSKKHECIYYGGCWGHTVQKRLMMGKGGRDGKRPVNFIYMRGRNMDDLQEAVTEIESHVP